MADTVAKIVIDADGSVARREFESVGDAAQAVGVDISTGIGGALDKTAAAFARLDAKIESGEMRGLPRSITQSTVALQQLQAELEQTRAQGGDVKQLELAVERFTQRLKEATTAAGKLADTQEEVNRTVKASAAAADFGLGKLGTSMGSMLELMSKMYFVANVLGQSLQGIAKAADSVQQAMGTATDGSREMNGELAKLGQSIASLDLVGASEALGRFTGSMIDGAEAADALAESTARWNEALSGPVGKMSRVLEAQRKFTDAVADQRKALEESALAIARQVAVEQESGEVHASTREEVKRLLDAYDRLGDPVDGALAKVAASLGILSTEQERAAKSSEDASKRQQESAEQAAAKEEERTAREIEAAAKRIAAAEEESARKIKALEDQIAAREKDAAAAQAAYDAEVARNQAQESGQSELELLRDKAILTEDEQKRLEELTRAQLSNATAQDKRRRATEAQRREDEAYAKVQEENLRLEQARSDWLTESLAQSQARRDATYDEVEANKYRVQGAQDLQDAEEALADRLVENGLITKEQAKAFKEYAVEQKNSKLASEMLIEASDEASESIAKLGDQAEKSGEGLDGLATASERSAEALKEIKAILPEIIQLAAQVRLGGAG